MRRARTWMKLIALAVVTTCLLGPGGARAEDHHDLDYRVFRVAGLTRGFDWHYGETPGLHVSEDGRGCEGGALLGGTGEEPLYPVGQVDELIEVLKGFVEPAVWETVEGADIHAQGEGLIFARAPRATLDAVARFLARLESRRLRSVRIELRAVPSTDTHDPQALAAHEDAWDLSLVGMDRQPAVGRAGTQKAWLAGYRGAVAQGASLSTPVVGVANLGLMARATATLGEDAGTVTLAVRAHVVRLASLETRDAGEGRRLESPNVRLATIDATLEMPAGAWRRVGASGGWTLLARARPATFQGSGPEPRPLGIRARGGPPYVARMIDVGEFGVEDAGRHSGTAFVMPTGFTPTEPPEMGSPSPLFPIESLVELFRHAAGEHAWEDPATIEARGGILLVRNNPAVIEEIQRMLHVLRGETMGSLEIEVEALDVPADLAAALAPAADALAADDEAHARLEAARGDESAWSIARDVLRVGPLRPGASRGRTQRRYLGGYEPTIAQEAHTARPVTFGLSEGLLVTVRASILSTGDAAHVQFSECQRARVVGKIRSVPTPCGPVELPELHMHRIRGGFVAPLDRPVLLSATGKGDRREILLVTVRRASLR